MLRSCGVECITRIERNRRYKLHFRAEYTQSQLDSVISALYDRMTECVYITPLESFTSGETPAPVVTVPVLAEGRAAIERINAQLGLGLDDRDLDYYTHVFAEVLRRDPTDVELFDIGKSLALFLYLLTVGWRHQAQWSHSCESLTHC
jgi:phosphoribosylformylglycinamidine synthase